MGELSQILIRKQKLVEKGIRALLKSRGEAPKIIHDAMSYSLLAGGKRIRPVLCLMTHELFAPVPAPALKCSLSLEFLHTYTLIHDDLPCMDNDDLRRGKPTLHKVYPENMALLAGDALLTKSFQIIADSTLKMPERGIRIVSDLAFLSGPEGVIGGQVLDLQAEKRKITPRELKEIHLNKTAKLLMASVRMGAILAGASEKDLKSLSLYAQNIGHAFQIADDILDEIGDTKKMGKKAGQDKKLDKATYVKFFGLDKSRKILRETVETAIKALKPFGEKAQYLGELARYIASRDK